MAQQKINNIFQSIKANSTKQSSENIFLRDLRKRNLETAAKTIDECELVEVNEVSVQKKRKSDSVCENPHCVKVSSYFYFGIIIALQ